MTELSTAFSTTTSTTKTANAEATEVKNQTSVLLTIKNLSVKLQDKVVLSSLDLNLNAGDILGLVGASGCGKTTLLNTIAGFAKVSEGTINLEGRLLSSNVDSRNEDGSSVSSSKAANKISSREEFNLPAEQRQVGMIFQDYALFPHLTVKQNIAFGISKQSKSEQQQQIDKLLSILKLSDYSDSYIHQLSGGQQQRVAIARALAPQPKLLLLDEPFSNIDARLRNELMVEIRLLLKQFNMTAIFVTHNKDEVFTFADKMAVMSQGKLLQFDNPTSICQQPNSYQVADFLQLGSWLPCLVNTNHATSLLGDFEIESNLNGQPINEQNSSEHEGLTHLLVKPSQLLLNVNLNENIFANAQVEYISVTEQGYHYSFRSLDSVRSDCLSTGTLRTDSPVEKSNLSFSKLSLYSDIVLSLNQQVALSIKPHDFLFFNKNN